MQESQSGKRFHLDRAAFLAGSLAAAGAGLCENALAAAPTATSVVPPERLLGQLMAGNKRFLDNDFPALSRAGEKRELLAESQAPFAAILSCADSRVIPNLVFVQGVGELFAVRVAGNYPDDLVTGSLEYSVEHLGTRLLMVLGHQNCGAVKATYSAIQTKTPLPPHLSAIENLITPGIADVVKARGTLDQAIEANVRAAVAKLKASPPTLAKEATEGRVLVIGAIYLISTGEVKLLE